MAYVSANKAPVFTPYKLSYVLATPITDDISGRVEGDIAVNGLTQVEFGSGVIVREKAAPILNSGVYHINASTIPTSILKNKALKITNVYKNGIIENKAKIITSTSIANGAARIEIPQSDFDTTAEYTITYQVQDQKLFTVPPYNAKATYAKNVRNALDDTVQRVEDNTRDISFLIQSMTEFYKRLKALGG